MHFWYQGIITVFTKYRFRRQFTISHFIFLRSTLIVSSHHRRSLLSGFFHSDFLTKILTFFLLLFLWCASRPAHLLPPFAHRNNIMCGCDMRSSSLCFYCPSHILSRSANMNSSLTANEILKWH